VVTSEIPLIEVPSLKAAKEHQSATLQIFLWMLQYILTLLIGISARHLRETVTVCFQCRGYDRPPLQASLTPILADISWDHAIAYAKIDKRGIFEAEAL
jgi:hypothetical protein